MSFLIVTRYRFDESDLQLGRFQMVPVCSTYSDTQIVYKFIKKCKSKVDLYDDRYHKFGLRKDDSRSGGFCIQC